MNHQENPNEAIEQIKHALRAIFILKLRASRFQEELKFYNEKKEKLEYSELLLMRLSNEVQFLAIDTFSLHQGIAKKKSLFSKVIKQYAEDLFKVDESPVKHLIYIGDEDSSSDEEKRNMQKIMDKFAFEERKNLRDSSGIKSCNHADLDEWLTGIIDKELLETLGKYRKDFAHRLDNLENLSKALTYHPPNFIDEVLNNISKVLDGYGSCFTNIILYRTSVDYQGIYGIYGSLSGEMQSAKLLPLIEYYEKKQS